MLGPWCSLDLEYHRRYDEYRDEWITTTTGGKPAKEMRSLEGKCGPNRNFYETNWQAFGRWLKKLFRRNKNDR